MPFCSLGLNRVRPPCPACYARHLGGGERADADAGAYIRVGQAMP